jgi:hypothetical protein
MKINEYTKGTHCLYDLDGMAKSVPMDTMFLRNIGLLSSDYMTSYFRRQNSS